MSNNRVELFYADWCGACVNFKPQWEAMTKTFDSKGISHKSYEEGSNAQLMEQKGISAFPTVLVDGEEIAPSKAQIMAALGLGQSGGAVEYNDIVAELFGEQAGGAGCSYPPEEQNGGFTHGLPAGLISSEEQYGGFTSGLPSALVSSEEMALSDFEQAGGSTDFKAKYYKYKAKYFGLMSARQ